MAQYGHNWYGTSYYGKTNAFSGWYETAEIFTDEKLKSTVTLNIAATLPSATYGPNAPEVQEIAGSWTYDNSLGKLYSNSADAELYMAATCDHLVLKYEQRTIGAKVNIEVTTTEPGKTPTVQNITLNTQAASVNANKTFEISNLAFGEQQVRITMAPDTPAGANFNFKGITARTAHLTIESRARLDDEEWSDATYQKLTTSVSQVSGSAYTVQAITPSYTDKNNIQFKIYLASSDNETTPEIDSIEMIAGDTSNRTANGEWSVVLDMEQIAINAGVSFSKVEEVVWSEDVPAATELTIRSQSSSDNLNIWDQVTVPYKQGVNRIKLKDGHNSGWVDSPFIAPASKHPHIVNKEWDKWDDQSFLPPDSAGTSVTYDFLSLQKDNELNPYLRITEPMKKANRTLRGSRLRNLDNVVRIKLKRTGAKQTPVVDYVHLTSAMYYEQDVVVEDQEFSAVDFNNTGKGIVLDMMEASFSNQFQVPPETNNPSYQLIDKTERPQDVILYLDSQKTEAIRDGKTTTLSNMVWAEAKVGVNGKTQLNKHYQYGGGQVKFPLKDEVQLAPTFTPSLSPDLRYRYHLLMGWPNEYHTTMEGDTISDIAANHGKTEEDFLSVNSRLSYNNDGTLIVGQKVQIPNDSVNEDVLIYWKSTGGERTSKSSHNAVIEEKVNMESDSITAEVAEASIYGWVDWVSEEKIYDGVVNLNDIRSEYKRTHLSPDSGQSTQIEYIAVSGDTYKKIANLFGVYESDVRRLNAAETDEEPAVGKKVLVPSRIVLPSIHPKAVVTDNPYEIEIVYNSVKKKDGKTLSTNVMTLMPIKVEYKKVEMRDVEVTRGQIENGKDLLPHPRITKIIRAQNAGKTRIYNPWDDDLGIGDFKLTDNHIDWSPVDVPADEPEAGELYLVDYEAEVPSKVTVHIDTDYIEEGGVDRIWRSPEVKEFKGMCYPGKDFVAELPDFGNWVGLPDANVEDVDYVIEDNDIWVKTWVEKRDDKFVVVGSLQDRIPKDNWFPTIKTGYYYLGKEEYYLFNEPITIEPTERDIPIASNVDYVDGKFDNAIKMQEGSANLVKNSGFEIKNNEQTVYKLTF